MSLHVSGQSMAELKKLVSKLSIENKSSHISEALAAGAGYKSNIAFLADLKLGSKAVPLLRLDAGAIARRLGALSNIPDLLPLRSQLSAAIHQIACERRLETFFVGPNSPLANDDFLPEWLSAFLHDNLSQGAKFVDIKLYIAPNLHEVRSTVQFKDGRATLVSDWPSDAMEAAISEIENLYKSRLPQDDSFLLEQEGLPRNDPFPFEHEGETLRVHIHYGGLRFMGSFYGAKITFLEDGEPLPAEG